MELSVFATLITDGFELLVAFRVHVAPQARQGRFRQHFNVVNTIVNGNATLQNGAPQTHVAFPGDGTVSHVYFGDHFARRGRHHTPDRYAVAEIEIRRRDLGWEAVASQAHAIALRSGFQRSLIQPQQSGIRGGPLELYVETEFLIFAPEPASFCLRLIRRNPHRLARLALKIVWRGGSSAGSLRTPAPGISGVDQPCTGANHLRSVL